MTTSSIPDVFLKLQHGESYVDGPTGRRWTSTHPVQSVAATRAKQLLRETVPLYQPNGEGRGNARRFVVVPAPAPEATEDEDLPSAEDGTERSDAEIDEEIGRASQAPAAPQAGAAQAGAQAVAPGRPKRDRLPRTTETEPSGNGG